MRVEPKVLNVLLPSANAYRQATGQREMVSRVQVSQQITILHIVRLIYYNT